MTNSVTEVKLSGKTLGLVDVPEDAENFDLSGNSGLELSYEIFDDNCDQVDWDYQDLPPGQWSIVGIASSLTEDMWKGIVPFSKVESVFFYNDYENKKCFKRSATESGLSLIAAHGKKPETTLVIIKM